MKTISRDKYLTILFDEQNKLLQTKWLCNTIEISIKEIEAHVAFIADTIKKYQPQYYIADERSRKFSYPVYLQNWVAFKIGTACAKAGVIKLAIELPDSILSNLSIKLSLTKNKKIPFSIKYLKNEEDAFEWFGIKNIKSSFFGNFRLKFKPVCFQQQ